MRVHCWLGVVVACGLPWIPAVCHAEAYTHDGFYLQMSLGGGYLHSSASLAGFDESVYGGAVVGSLWIGGSLIPGLVLGGGTLGAIAPSPTLKLTSSGQAPMSGDAGANMQLQMLGLVADFYPDPHKGLHFQALVGYAELSFTQDNSGFGDTGVSGSGLGLMGGVGYEWWVSTEWSIGVLGRFSYASTKIDEVTYSTISPALLASFTYN